MKTEENKRMFALACTVADMKTENMYLAQRVQELVDEYNNVAHQLIGKKNRKNKDSSKQTIDEMQQMREHCDKLEKENVELAQRMQQLADENNEMARQLNNEEAPSKQTLDELEQMREQCDKLDRKNKELEHFAIAMREFVLDKDFYMQKGIPCKYYKGKFVVGSTVCLKCLSCLGSLGVNGVICEKRLDEEIGISPDDE